MYSIGQIEDAIVAALSSASLNAKAFHGELGEDAYLKEVAKPPLVLVSFERTVDSKKRTVSLRGSEFYFNIYIIARNLRSRSSAAKGDAGTAGIFNAMETVRQTLSGSTIGLNIQPMERVSEKPYAKNARQSVYRQEWKIETFE